MRASPSFLPPSSELVSRQGIPWAQRRNSDTEGIADGDSRISCLIPHSERACQTPPSMERAGRHSHSRWHWGVLARGLTAVLVGLCFLALVLSEASQNQQLTTGQVQRPQWSAASPGAITTQPRRAGGPIPSELVMISKHGWGEFYKEQPAALVRSVWGCATVHNATHGRATLGSSQARTGVPLVWLNDTQCVAVLEALGRPSLAAAFAAEPFGPYKSDICRVAYLYVRGGFYMDCDMGCLPGVDVVQRFARQQHGLITAIEVAPETGVFQSFLAAAPGHPVLELALNLTEAYYAGTHQLEYGFTVGTSIFRSAVERYRGAGGYDIHLLREVYDPTTPGWRRWAKTILGARGCDIVVADDMGAGDILFRSHVLHSAHCRPIWPLPGSLWLLLFPVRAAEFLHRTVHRTLLSG